MSQFTRSVRVKLTLSSTPKSQIENQDAKSLSYSLRSHKLCCRSYRSPFSASLTDHLEWTSVQFLSSLSKFPIRFPLPVPELLINQYLKMQMKTRLIWFCAVGYQHNLIYILNSLLLSVMLLIFSYLHLWVNGHILSVQELPQMCQ